MRAVEQAHALLAKVLSPGDLAIDATAGNGHDAAFLARTVGATGHVHAFDLQTAAIEATRRLLRTQDLMTRVTLHHLGHEKMEEVLPSDLPGRISVVTFNLGYLPGGDKSLVTDPVSTLPALQSAMRFLRPGGLLTVLAYPGHPGGREECEAVRREVATWTDSCEIREFAGAGVETPILFGVRKS